MIAQFALRLICGMSFCWCLMPRRQVTDGFFRIQMLIVMGLSVLAALLSSGSWRTAIPPGDPGRFDPVTTAWLAGLLAVTALVGSMAWALGRRRGGTVCIFGIAAVSLALVLGIVGRGQVLAVPVALSSAALLGTAMVAMLLGHWYLTATGMSLAPLVHLNVLLGIATLARMLVACRGVVEGLGDLEETSRTAMLALRCLAGLVGPLVIVVMVARILKYKNTQSATGVLYVGVLLVLIGELTALMLSRELPIPV